jgi:hypothetical protein
MPPEFWGEVVSTAVFLLNRALTKSFDGKMPFEAWYERKPAVSFLRMFGGLGYVKDKRPNLRKLDDRSTPMVFIAYKEGSKAACSSPGRPSASTSPATSSSMRMSAGTGRLRRWELVRQSTFFHVGGWSTTSIHTSPHQALQQGWRLPRQHLLPLLLIVTKFLGRWGRGTGSWYVVRYLRETFTLRVENEPVNPGRGRRTRIEGRRW